MSELYGNINLNNTLNQKAAQSENFFTNVKYKAIMFKIYKFGEGIHEVKETNSDLVDLSDTFREIDTDNLRSP